MDIILVSISGDTSVIRFRDICCRSASIDTVMVLIHPASDFRQDRGGFFREFTFRIRSYIQDHISTFGNTLYQLLDQHGSRFVIVVICAVAPVIVHGEACFPYHRIPFFVTDSFRRDDLFRAYKIAMIRCRIAFIQRSSSLTTDFQTVINDDSRL